MVMGSSKDVAKALANKKEKKKPEASKNPYQTGLQEGIGVFEDQMGAGVRDSLMAQRSKDKKDIMDRRRDLSRGLNARENAALRAQFQSQINASAGQQRGNLAASLASRGIKGGQATSQMSGVEANVAGMRNEAARNQLVENLRARDAGLNAYENTVENQEAQIRDQMKNRLALGDAFGQKNVDYQTALEQAAASKKKGK